MNLEVSKDKGDNEEQYEDAIQMTSRSKLL